MHTHRSRGPGRRSNACPPGRREGVRRLFAARPVAPRSDAARPGIDRPTAPSGSGSPGLTLAAVVARGAVVGVDDSPVVRSLLTALVEAGPSLVGTASLDVVLTLTTSRAVQTGALIVRLFGGAHRPAAGSFTGPRSVLAVAATSCDVALVGGRLLGTDVWVPADVAAGRAALMRDARRTYLVLPAADGQGHAPADRSTTDPGTDSPGAADERGGWIRLADLSQFDGVLETDGPPEPPERSVAA